MSWSARDVVELVLAVGGALTALVAMLKARASNRQAQSAAQRVEVEALSQAIKALQSENHRLNDCVRRLVAQGKQDRAEIDRLRAELQQAREDLGRLRAASAELRGGPAGDGRVPVRDETLTA